MKFTTDSLYILFLILKAKRSFFTILNDRGLHTRPSTELVRTATAFRSEIRLIRGRETVNAKSLLGILMLAATKGSRIVVEAVGIDAEEAIDAILQLAKMQFNISY